jgi:anti-anti-sigma regulatory factor
MQITTTKRDDVAIMHIAGDVDASNYADMINKAQELYDDGARGLLLDLGKVPYVSSAGLMALHTVTRIFAGQAVQSKDGGKPSFRALNSQQDANVRETVKLLNPQPAVEQVLDVVGLKQFFEIHTDLDAAVNSFQG